MTAAALAITAGAVGAGSSLTQGAAARDNANQQAAFYETQQGISRQNSQIVAQQTSAKEDLQRREARRIIARQRAGLAESGVDSTVGSALDILDQSSVEAELDAMTIRYEGELARRNLQLEGDQAGINAKLASKGGDRAFASGVIGAGSSLLSGFAAAKGFRGGTLNPTSVRRT